MIRSLLALMASVVLTGCATLPGTVKENYGVAVLPLAYVEESDLRDSLVDIVLHFNHDKVSEKVSPRNGYTVISTSYTDLEVVGYSIQPKDRVSMAGGFGVVYPLRIELSTQPGVVKVAPVVLQLTQYRISKDSYYSYSSRIEAVSLEPEQREALRMQLTKDPNAKLWTFPPEPDFSWSDD